MLEKNVFEGMNIALQREPHNRIILVLVKINSKTISGMVTHKKYETSLFGRQER